MLRFGGKAPRCLSRCARGPSAAKARLTGGPCHTYRMHQQHSGPATTHCGNHYGLRESEPAAGRGGGCMGHLVPHGISRPKSARPSPGAEHAERPIGQWVLSGPRTYVINKAMRPAMHETCACHCRLQAQDFFALQRHRLLFSHNRNALLCTRHCLLLVAVIVDLLLWC
jgi:hypothetical protein